MKNIVIYHKADYDGLFSREVAKSFLPASTEFIGWDYGDPIPQIPDGAQLYMIDISIKELMDYPNLIWIDHHKSAIAEFSQDIKGYRIDGVAACRLAYQWFLKEQRDLAGMAWTLPDFTEYDKRTVQEPRALTLAGEYDVWVHKGDGDFEFQYGLDAQESLDWDTLLDGGNEPSTKYVDKILSDGAVSMRCVAKRDAQAINEKGYIQPFKGYKFLALNTAGKGSGLHDAKDKPETGHDALMVFNWDGNRWNFSLYHAKHNKGIDLSIIAKEFGGGGHAGACGFKTKTLPF